MTKLLEQGIEAVWALSPERQDLAGELLLGLAGADRFQLTPDQLEDLKISIAQADRGEFATEQRIAAASEKFG